MLSDPQGVEYYRPAINPQSFGADAPPTWGLRQIGPPRGGPFLSDTPNEALPKSDLLAEVLTHPIYPMRQPRKRAFAYPIYPMKSGVHYQKSSIFLVKLKYITYLCSEIVYRIDTLRMLK